MAELASNSPVWTSGTRWFVAICLAGTAVFGWGTGLDQWVVAQVQGAPAAIASATAGSHTGQVVLSSADTQFLAVLDNGGVPYSTPSAAVAAGQLAGLCHQAGYTDAAIVAYFEQSNTTAGGPYSVYQLSVLVKAGVAAYGQ